MYTLHVNPTNYNLRKYEGALYYTGIKSFNNLPATNKTLHYDTQIFKPALRDYLLNQSTHSLHAFTSIETFQRYRHTQVRK